MDPDTIANEIKADEPIVTSFIGTFNPALGELLHLGLKLLAAAEPAVYKSVTAFLSGQDLTDQQKADKAAAIQRLQNPDDYFKD
jgi:hypothetical protein